MTSKESKTCVQGSTIKDLAYVITLARPEKLNAINRDMWRTLLEELNKGCSSSLPAIIIQGSELAFSAGDDIDDMYKLKDPDEAYEFFEQIYRVFKAMVECPKPVVCAVKGLAVGGGAELLLACDVVIASDKAWFSFPEIALGLMPPFLSSVGPLSLGRRRSAYLAMTGQRLSAQEAKNIGLVDEVVNDTEFEEAVNEVLRLLGSYSPSAIAAIKKVLAGSLNLDLARQAARALAELSLTPAAKERMRLFIEHKFKPAAKEGP